MKSYDEPGTSPVTNLTAAPQLSITGYDFAPHFMSAIIESANDAIVSKTLDGTITSWNPAAERIFGYRAEEIIGKSVLTLIPPDRQHEESIIIGRIKAGERIEHYETIRRRKDGTFINISLTISPIKGPDGQIVGASKIARDITDLKRTEQQLRVSQDNYRTLFNSIDEGFCVLQVIFDEQNRPVDWIFLEVNPAFEKHNGVKDAEGKSARELLPGLESHWFEVYGKVALTGEPVRLQEGSDFMQRWFDLYAFRVGDPESHKVAVLFNDITARIRADKERQELLDQLETERSKLAYLFEKSPAFVAALQGSDHIFELINPAFLQLVGHRDLIGKSARDAFPEVEGQGFFELLDRVYRTGEAFTGREMPIHLQREPGGPLELRYLDLLYQPVFDATGSVTGIFAHGIDITEQVQARKAAETANRSKDEFLATLSHELRTPLNAILGWAQLMSSNQLDAEGQRHAQDIIQRNAKVQAQLIEDILDVSRIISGKLKLEVRPVDLSSVVELAVESVRPAAEAKGIRLQRVVDYGNSMISGDPDRLQQIVWNLLSNAIKFTPKSGKVQLRLERVNSHIEIIVTDNGIGMAPEVLPYVFDRFRQADSTSTRQHGGLGLGLAIVRHLVEMHGGTVEAESAGEGQGATFTVKLPLLAVRQAELAGAELREHPTGRRDVTFDCPPELEGLRVLVVDDEEDARLLVRAVLEGCGAKVKAVSNVSEALTTIQEHRPDVLISDLGMPDEDGYSLIQKVRSLSPDKGGHTPAAALTAFARLEDRMKVLRSGFQIHLPKPVEPAELIAVVLNLSGRHNSTPKHQS